MPTETAQKGSTTHQLSAGRWAVHLKLLNWFILIIIYVYLGGNILCFKVIWTDYSKIIRDSALLLSENSFHVRSDINHLLTESMYLSLWKALNDLILHHNTERYTYLSPLCTPGEAEKQNGKASYPCSWSFWVVKFLGKTHQDYLILLRALQRLGLTMEPRLT